jgi:hypothetical protein
MTKAEIIALAERCEGASAAQQDELIDDAWDVLGPIRHWTAEQAARIAEMLDAEAYESAAMILVPHGLLWTMDSWEGSRWSAGIWCDRRWLVHTSEKRTSKTPALALTSASLRAIAEGMEE